MRHLLWEHFMREIKFCESSIAYSETNYPGQEYLVLACTRLRLSLLRITLECLKSFRIAKKQKEVI